MSDARGSNQLISGVGTYIEPCAQPCHLQRDWLNVQSTKNPRNFRILKIEIDAPELRQHGHFPDDNCGNTPAISAQQALLSRGQLATDRVKQYVSVKIQHPTLHQWRESDP